MCIKSNILEFDIETYQNNNLWEKESSKKLEEKQLLLFFTWYITCNIFLVYGVKNSVSHPYLSKYKNGWKYLVLITMVINAIFN
jgi:hypothetical protein